MGLALAVSLAAALGAVCRFLLDRAVHRRVGRHFPWGTLVINVTGSFVLGVATGLALHHGLDHVPVSIVGVGFAGGYTTWSTYLLESAALLERRQRGAALANVAGSLAAGFLAAAAGLGLALL